MPASVFPATLPGPSVATVTPADRRLLSDVPGPQNARGIQRDYLAVQHLEWNLLDSAAALMFQSWWRTSLIFGAAWFAATWPLPLGWQSATRRFLGTPRWQHLPGGFWRVSADCELRGRGLPPVTHLCTTGPAWSQTVKPNHRHYGMYFQNALFVAPYLADGGGVGGVSYSSNGSTWTDASAFPSLAAGFHITTVAYGNGIFVAYGNATNQAWQSTDAASWAAGAGVPNVTKLSQPTGMWFGNGLFVICSGVTAAIYTSANASGQTTQTTPATFNTGLYHAGVGLHYACDQAGGNIYTSPDTITWSLKGTTSFTSIVSTKKLVTDGGARFIAIDGSTQRSFVSVSSDYGATWANSVGLPATAVFYVDLVYLPAQGIWMLTDNNGRVFLSLDSGSNWSAAASDLNPFLGNSNNWWMAANPAGTLWAAVPVTGSPGTVAAVGVC